jgi:hypothetical protein
MDWSASIEINGKNAEKLKDFTKAAPNGSRINPIDPKSGVLWDNSNINFTPYYTFQCVDLTGKIPDGRSILADDFIVPPLETWTIKNVYSIGYSDKMILPDAFAVEFYADNNGLPGNLIYTEDIVPSDINFATQNLDLATPLVLNEGHYWIAVYAVYNGATGTNTTVWYWSTGTVPIGNNIAYNDFGNIWGFSSWGWFHLDIFGAQKPSCYFIINGDKAGAFGLSETSGTILPGECQVITLAFDATILTQGTYQATLTFNSDPDVGQVELPLTLNVLSEVNGVVTDANTGLPHANAEVTFAGYNPVFTGLDGVYTLGVLPGEYAATVQADGYCDLTVSNIIVGDISLVQDFLLTGPLFSIEPTPIEKNLDYGTVIGTSEVMVSNPGTCDLPFTSSESAEWLAVNPSNGIIPAGGNVVLTFTYNPTGLFYGSYEATLDFELGVITDQSVNVKLSIAQEIMIPAANQWGGISTYVDVNAKGASSIEALLAEILDNMVILIGEEGIFWPGQNLNTIGNWNNNFGYKIKMSGNDELFFDGTPVTNKTATYSAGIHIIPVLSNAAVSTQAIFGGKPIEFAFSFDGNVYWPNGGINTLNQLLPGFAYLVRFNDITTLDFEVKGGSAANNPPVHINTTNWNDVTRSGDVHIVSLPAKASADLREGDVLGVFNSVGTCTGMSEFDGSNLALVVYGNDMTTVETDGMNTGDFMMYKVFRNGEEFETSVTYSPQMPNYDGTYADNGLSMITNLKLGALAVSENPMAGISIYPNPSTGVFNINMNGSKQTIGMVVSNAKGQVIYKTQMNVSQQFDLSSQPNGVYFLRLIGENSVRLEKLIVK